MYMYIHVCTYKVYILYMYNVYLWSSSIPFPSGGRPAVGHKGPASTVADQTEAGVVGEGVGEVVGVGEVGTVRVWSGEGGWSHSRLDVHQTSRGQR